jgi:hypothetical protein
MILSRVSTTSWVWLLWTIISFKLNSQWSTSDRSQAAFFASSAGILLFVYLDLLYNRIRYKKRRVPEPPQPYDWQTLIPLWRNTLLIAQFSIWFDALVPRASSTDLCTHGLPATPAVIPVARLPRISLSGSISFSASQTVRYSRTWRKSCSQSLSLEYAFMSLSTKHTQIISTVHGLPSAPHRLRRLPFRLEISLGICWERKWDRCSRPWTDTPRRFDSHPPLLRYGRHVHDRWPQATLC